MFSNGSLWNSRPLPSSNKRVEELHVVGRRTHDLKQLRQRDGVQKRVAVALQPKSGEVCVQLDAIAQRRLERRHAFGYVRRGRQRRLERVEEITQRDVPDARSRSGCKEDDRRRTRPEDHRAHFRHDAVSDRHGRERSLDADRKRRPQDRSGYPIQREAEAVIERHSARRGIAARYRGWGLDQ